MSTVIIPFGIPGSGKSTLANKIFQWSEDCRLISADDYFYKNNKYEYRKEDAKKAHGQCLRDFIYSLTKDVRDTIVIHNTNVNTLAINPYIAIAEAYGAKIYPIYLNIPLDICKERQIHNVNEDLLIKMHSSLLETIQYWPKFWPNYIEVDEKTDLLVLKEKLGFTK